MEVTLPILLTRLSRAQQSPLKNIFYSLSLFFYFLLVSRIFSHCRFLLSFRNSFFSATAPFLFWPLSKLGSTDPNTIPAAVKHNARAVGDRLPTLSPPIKKLVESGAVKIISAVYDIDSGLVSRIGIWNLKFELGLTNCNRFCCLLYILYKCIPHLSLINFN